MLTRMFVIYLNVTLGVNPNFDEKSSPLFHCTSQPSEETTIPATVASIPASIASIPAIVVGTTFPVTTVAGTS